MLPNLRAHGVRHHVKRSQRRALEPERSDGRANRSRCAAAARQGATKQAMRCCAAGRCCQGC
eukprot:COSAG04_NODE_241_length_19022_cov_38.409819_5_plen_62_part_00